MCDSLQAIGQHSCYQVKRGGAGLIRAPSESIQPPISMCRVTTASQSIWRPLQVVPHQAREDLLCWFWKSAPWVTIVKIDVTALSSRQRSGRGPPWFNQMPRAVMGCGGSAGWLAAAMHWRTSRKSKPKVSGSRKASRKPSLRSQSQEQKEPGRTTRNVSVQTTSQRRCD